MSEVLILKGYQPHLHEWFTHALMGAISHEYRGVDDDHRLSLGEEETTLEFIHCLWQGNTDDMADDIKCLVDVFWKTFSNTLLEDIKEKYQEGWVVTDFLVNTRDHFELFLTKL